MSAPPAWIHRGKTIAQLMRELATFEDDSAEVRISTDDGATHLPISLVVRQDGHAVLVYCGKPDDARGG